MKEDSPVTLTGLGVMLVALSRFTALTSPGFVSFLRMTLSSAENAGLPDEELELLRLVIQSVSSISSEGDIS